MANDAMAVCAAGSMGVGPGVKRRFLRNIQRILGSEMFLVYRNRVALHIEEKASSINHEGHYVTRRLLRVCFSYVYLRFLLVSLFSPCFYNSYDDAQRTDAEGHHHSHEGTRRATPLLPADGQDGAPESRNREDGGPR